MTDASTTSKIRSALEHQAPATDDQLRTAVSDALSVGGHSHQPLIAERLHRAGGHVPAIVRRLLDAEARSEELQRDSDLLNALEAAGVDNWDGYEIARDNLS